MSKNSNRLLHNADHYVTSPFGYRVNPVTGRAEGHNGVDYGTGGKKVPCYAVGDGTVLRVSKDRYGANFVYVRFQVVRKVGLYYHLDKVNVQQGYVVNKNTQIGIVGTTGQSTGVHLHFSWIEDNNQAMNYYGANYLDFEKYEFEEEEMTEAEVKAIVKEVLAESREQPSAWSVEEWAEATKIGITDGTRPQAYPTREQVAAMVVRGRK